MGLVDCLGDWPYAVPVVDWNTMYQGFFFA